MRIYLFLSLVFLRCGFESYLLTHLLCSDPAAEQKRWHQKLWRALSYLSRASFRTCVLMSVFTYSMRNNCITVVALSFPNVKSNIIKSIKCNVFPPFLNLSCPLYSEQQLLQHVPSEGRNQTLSGSQSHISCPPLRPSPKHPHREPGCAHCS
jgi:hypothetical protein